MKNENRFNVLMIVSKVKMPNVKQTKKK
jgi:hypothetical protein